MAKRGRSRRATWSRGKRGLRLARFAGMLIVALAIAIATVWITRIPGAPSGEPNARVLIPVGASFREAAESLAVARLIRWPRAFSLYGSLKGRDRTIRAGTYQLRRGQDWSALIDALHTGRGVMATVTIPEGWNLRRIVPYLAKSLEIPADSIDAAVRDPAQRTRLDIPAASLEGYLFPDTYAIPLGTTAGQAVALLLARFERAWKPEWNARLDSLHRTRHEILTLASIIETEVERSEERPIVSAVYWNRLKANIALQADPTVLYALNRPLGRVFLRDLKVNSPYNTYVRTGLPPGPIASPGAASIEAALYPANVPYRYFVATGDGHHEFRRTYQEHLAAVAKIRAERKKEEERLAKLQKDSAQHDTTKK